MISTILIFLCSLNLAYSQDFGKTKELPYYGADFYTQKLADADLKKQVFQILSNYHNSSERGFDDVASSCSKDRNCYRHTPTGYKRAREFLFGEFYLVNSGQAYGIRDLYCQRVVDSAEFPGSKPGPNLIPDPKIVNAEHTWPQSKFSKKFSKEDQKSDLHNLFPVDSEINSRRSSLDFGNIENDSMNLKCSSAHIGKQKNGSEIVFEPHQAHKGNVARAVFYFSIRYDMPIDEVQEKTLKEWHRLDPVDTEEEVRNNEIFKLQKNRNPFIDHPDLVFRISDF